jgi:SET domain-containing protein
MIAPTYRIKNSRIAGRGLFAARFLTAGETVAAYAGERIDKAESARRQAAAEKVFIFELDDNFDVDGDTLENPARFINHSCEPNCEAVATEGIIQLRAWRDIVAGEELTFDYGYRLAAFPGHPCRCGAKSCAGFIVGRADRWRVRRLLNRPGRSLLAERRARPKEVCA